MDTKQDIVDLVLLTNAMAIGKAAGLPEEWIKHPPFQAQKLVIEDK